MPALKDENLQALKRLKWVKEAKKIAGGYKIRTHEGALATTLTHMLHPGPLRGSFRSGGLMQEPRNIPLPQYWIYLEEDGYRFSLARRPKPRVEYFGIIPQYHHFHSRRSWNEVFTPCYGSGSGSSPENRSIIYDYRESRNWVERAIVASIYVQTSIPHYGRYYWSTMFAYNLGLVGDEVVEGEKITKTQ